jgi:hypothetical protein
MHEENHAEASGGCYPANLHIYVSLTKSEQSGPLDLRE